MRQIRKLSVMLALCLVLALLPVTSANAAESGSLWMNRMPVDDGVTMAICADTAVASGVITITYDSKALTFRELTVDSTYVALHAVNAEKAGTIRISWIGTGAVADGGYVLMRLSFAGVLEQDATLSGSIQDGAGNSIAVSMLNMTDLNAAIVAGEAVDAANYTADSYAALRSALDAANGLLSQEAVTQTQLDAATQALVTAMENLVVYVPEPPETQPPATEPAPTEPNPTAPSQPGSTPAATQPTQPSSTQAPTPAPKGDNSWILYVLGALVAVAAVAAVVILKKRGRK